MPNQSTSTNNSHNNSANAAFKNTAQQVINKAKELNETEMAYRNMAHYKKSQQKSLSKRAPSIPKIKGKNSMVVSDMLPNNRYKIADLD